MRLSLCLYVSVAFDTKWFFDLNWVKKSFSFRLLGEEPEVGDWFLQGLKWVFYTKVLLHVVAFILSPPAYWLNRGTKLGTLLFKSLVHLVNLFSLKLLRHRWPLLSLSLVLQVRWIKKGDFTTAIDPVEISSDCIAKIPGAYHIII